MIISPFLGNLILKEEFSSKKLSFPAVFFTRAAAPKKKSFYDATVIIELIFL